MTSLGALATDPDLVDAVTDVAGIAAVLGALVLLVVLETRRAAGRDSSRRLGLATFGMTVLALVIIGGRFQWIPDAGEAQRTSSEAAAGDDSTSTEPTATSTTPESGLDDQTTTTQIDDGGSSPDDAPPTSLVGPPTPTVDDEPAPQDPEVETPGGGVDGEDPARGPPSGPTSTYVVVEGDNFWDIAESMLEAETGGPVADADVIPFWQDLVEANQDGLVEPGNPDLILPGQMLDIPPMGGASP